jgi:hypothetical protein
MRKNEIENLWGQDLGRGGDGTISQYPPDIPRSIAAIHLDIRRGFLRLKDRLLSVLYTMVNFYKGDWD